MRAPRTILLAAALTVALAGCGSNNEDEVVGPRGSGEPQTSSGKPDDLVVLEDDKGLQPAENIVPLVRTESVDEPLTEALNAVSEVLTLEAVIDMNRAADVERRTPEAVAEEFVADNGLDEGVDGGSGKVVVGAANFNENVILANIYSLALEGAGYETEVKPAGNREVYLEAIGRGEIDVMPEYAGTVTEFMNSKKNGENAAGVATADVEDTLAAAKPFADERGLTFLEPAEAFSANAFAVTRKFAEENDLRTLSDLADYEGELILGGPAECPTRPFCGLGLKDTYGIEPANFVSLDVGGPLTKTALKQGRIQLGLVFSTDGSLSAL
jgi:osmoprotectant transport system substrate-binding protein